jgi:hypothetical protein
MMRLIKPQKHKDVIKVTRRRSDEAESMLVDQTTRSLVLLSYDYCTALYCAEYRSTPDEKKAETPSNTLRPK